jgi:hypothetical protein
LQEPCALPIVDLDILQRFDEPVDHRQRRLELVRHVGDEVAPHAGDRFELGHVPRHQQLLLRGERHELQCKRAPGIAIRGDDDGSRVIPRLGIAVEFGLPDQVDDRLSAIQRKIEPELRARSRVGRHQPVPEDRLHRFALLEPRPRRGRCGREGAAARQWPLPRTVSISASMNP